MSPSREATPLIRPLLHCRGDGLIRGGGDYSTRPAHCPAQVLQYSQLGQVIMTLIG